MKQLQILKQPWVLLTAGIVAGLVLFGALRFITYKDNSVHYHANFALYINGVRDKFNNPGFYEEVTACAEDDSNNPHERAHLHDELNDVIHIHAKAVTWGQLFNNLGYSIGNQHLETLGKVFTPDANHKLSFILNGQPASDVAELVIESRDRLLVSYGAASNQKLSNEFQSISKSATKFNQQQDPASCKGTEPTGWRARWRHIWH